MRRAAVVTTPLLAALLLIPATLGAQERMVAGSVTSGVTLDPLSGVQVSVIGSQIGTLTDATGAYSMSVPAGAEALVFTQLGYRSQEAPVTDRVDIQMFEEPIGLEGITVTALGVRRERRSLGYSVQEVSGDDLAEVPEVNIVNALQGNVAGVHITNAGPTGGSSRIVIRGASSIAGSNQPLFVVDGVPIHNGYTTNDGYGGIDYGNGVSDLDPINIESISVLKGPNAAALYGSRAAAGAVVITMKSGTGAPGGGLGVTGTMSLTTEEPLRLPNYQNAYGQGLYGEFQYVDGAGGGLWDFVDESWGPKLDGRPIDQFTGPQQPWLAHPDNVRSFFRTGTTFNTNAAISRAGERSNLRLSISNMELRGMSPGNEQRRLNMALKGGASLTDRLTSEASLTYVDQDVENRPGTGYDTDNPMQSFVWFGRQVDMDALRNYRCTGAEPTPCTLDGGQYNWNYNYHNNPFWQALVNENGDERDRLIGHVGVDYRLADWVTASARAGRDWYRHHRKRVTAPNSLDDNGLGSFGEDTYYESETNIDLLLRGTRELADNIVLDLTAGANNRTTRLEGSGVSVDELTVPGIYTIDNAAATPSPWDNLREKEIRSVFGSASLNYGGYWNLDWTGRNDWSSTLPAGNNSYFYPSVSSALVFTEALGMQSSLLPSGKVRASWTRVGNDAAPYQLASVFSAQDPWSGVPMFAVPNDLPNTALKPEETTAWEVGADLGFFDERLGFVLTHYQRETRNQILDVEVSRASGYRWQVLNAGTVENRGWELLLQATPVELANGFSWDLTVNWGKNNSEVTALHGDLETLVLGSYWSMNIEARLGEPYGAFFGNGYLRNEDGDLLLTEDGMPRRDPVRRVLGNYNPDWNAGIQNRVAWGPLDISVLVDGQSGGDVFSVTNWFGEYAGVLESTLLGRENDFCDPGVLVDGILPDGTRNGTGGNDVRVCPQDYFARNFGVQEASIDDASYIKLREVRIGYRLPNAWLDTVGFTDGVVSLIGRNLFLWSKIENIDPETAFDASNVQGIEFGQFPTARSIGLSLSLGT